MDKNQFKLIAIQPLEGCTDNIRKVLKENQIYYFHQGYTIDNDTVKIAKNEITPSNFYNTDGLQISVHTIVGNNGSGKSTIVELLMRVVNNLSYVCYGSEKVDMRNDAIVPVMNVYANLYYQVWDDDNSKSCIYRLSTAQIPVTMSKPIDQNKYIDSLDIECRLKELNSDNAEIVINRGNAETYDDNVLKNFFYTLILNYSSFAFNSKNYADERVDWHIVPNPERNSKSWNTPNKCWLDGLFHKNDGYKVPIVINPYRKNGNIDINIENYLTNNRFISLLIDEDKNNRVTNINDENIVSSIEVRSKDKNLNEDLASFVHLDLDASLTKDFDSNLKIAIDKTEKIPTLGGFMSILIDTLIKDRVSLSQTYLNEILFSKDNAYKISLQDISNGTYKEFPKLTAIINSIIDKISIYVELYNHIVNYWDMIIFGDDINKRKECANNNISDFDRKDAYLIAKTIKVIETYGKDVLNIPLSIGSNVVTSENIEKNKESINKAIDVLYADKSHITLKVRQILSYKHTTHNIYDKPMTIDINTLSESITKLYSAEQNPYFKDDIMNFLPPPNFDVDILLKEKDTTKKPYSISQLSSGERQLIFSNSTILYHLKNLESAHLGGDRVKYKFVNIIMDEVELYYHPEMQRRQIDQLIKSISKIKFQHIKGVNICFITHSPIILSDIPRCNTLLLEKGNSHFSSTETFAANIHSLYRDDFFIKGMPIGEFAKTKINKLFDKLSEGVSDELTYKEIQMIGEPLLKTQLMKLYNQNYPYNIEDRISRLEKELEELKHSQIN